MHWYEIAKVVHFMGLIAIGGFFIIYTRAGMPLRAATDMAEVRVWLGLLEAARPMVPGGSIMMLLSGFAMAALRWRGAFPFITIGIVVVVAFWIVGTMIVGRHLRAMRDAATAERGPVPAELSRIILTPRPWSALFAINLAVLGVLFVMTTKLGWVAAVSFVAVMAVLGAVLGAGMVRRELQRRSAPGG